MSSDRRTRLQGGFVITPETALEWANGIAPVPITLTSRDMSVVWQFIEMRISPSGGRFSTVGEVADVEFMVVTQRARFNGYKEMDPSLIPQFKEGPRETVARQLQEREGVRDYTFATRLG